MLVVYFNNIIGFLQSTASNSLTYVSDNIPLQFTQKLVDIMAWHIRCRPVVLTYVRNKNVSNSQVGGT
jgi:hypothetical protein